MRYRMMISAWFLIVATQGAAYSAENPPKSMPVTIQTIDSDTLVGQFWNPNPSPVEAIVLKRKQRAKK